jgi:hypothetical protein
VRLQVIMNYHARAQSKPSDELKAIVESDDEGSGGEGDQIAQTFGRDHIFCNLSGARPAEPSSVAAVATYHTLTELLLYLLSERCAQDAKSITLSRMAIEYFRVLTEATITNMKGITK